RSRRTTLAISRETSVGIRKNFVILLPRNRASPQPPPQTLHKCSCVRNTCSYCSSKSLVRALSGVDWPDRSREPPNPWLSLEPASLWRTHGPATHTGARRRDRDDRRH